MAVAAAVLASAPGRLAAADWPLWLGPEQDGTSRETGWLKKWPEAGPTRLFELKIGEGYSPLVVAAGHLILFHRVRGDLLVESRDPLSGAGKWRFTYPTDYVDRYGYNGGPRCSPIIDTAGEPRRVFALGPTGVLHALELESGKLLWRRDLQGEHRLDEFFFGVGAAPILWRDFVIVHLGGTEPGTGAVLALERTSGKTAWRSHTGGGSYAAARTVAIDGAEQLFVFHREGLGCFDPATGRSKWEFPWRSRLHESVNATTPVVAGDVVFISAAYRTGAAALRVRKDSFEVLWKDEAAAREKVLESHWSNVCLADGHLYGFSGRHEEEARLTCVELKSGKVKWRWEGWLGRGSMLAADGHFIALGERGDLGLLKLSPSGHEVVEGPRRILGYPAWAPPVLADGLLYLRDERRLVGLDLRPPKAPAGGGEPGSREPAGKPR